MLQGHKQLEQRVILEHFDAWSAVRTRKGLPWHKRLAPPVTDMVNEFQSHLARLPVPESGRPPDLILVGYRHGCRLLQRTVVEELTNRKRLVVLARVRRIIQLAPTYRSRYRWVFLATVATLIAACVVQFVEKLYDIQKRFVEAALVILTFVPALLLALAQFLGWSVKNSVSNASENFVNLIERGSKRKSGTWPIAVSSEQAPDFKVADERDVFDVVDKLIHPVPHRNVYEVRLEEVNEIISPITVTDIPLRLRDKIQADHVISWTRSIEFQPYNITTRDSDLEPWTLSLSTSGLLDLVQAPNDKNEWKSDEEWAYKINRKNYLFRFHPEHGQSYTLRLNVYGSHGPGNRDGHSHLRADANYERHVRVIDFRPMLNAGYRFADGIAPRAWHVPGILPFTEGVRELDNGFCANLHDRYIRKHGIPLDNQSHEPGVYIWEVREVRNGGLLAYEYEWSERGTTKTAEQLKIAHSH